MVGPSSSSSILPLLDALKRASRWTQWWWDYLFGFSSSFVCFCIVSRRVFHFRTAGNIHPSVGSLKKLFFHPAALPLRMLFQQHLLTIEIFAHWPSSCSNLKETTTMMTVFFKKNIIWQLFTWPFFYILYTIPRWWWCLYFKSEKNMAPVYLWRVHMIIKLFLIFLQTFIFAVSSSWRENCESHTQMLTFIKRWWAVYIYIEIH